MKSALQALFLLQVARDVSARCTEAQARANAKYLPDLAPHAPEDLEVKGDNMVWTSRVTNRAKQGDFTYIDGNQVITDDRGRVICEEAAPLVNELFTVYNKDGVYVSKSLKEVSCLMDSEGGSNGDAHFTGQRCAEQVMGISAGGTDMYNSATRAQRLRIRGWPAGEYTIVNELHVGPIKQARWSNDVSWTHFVLRNERGGRKSVHTIEGCNGWEFCADRLEDYWGRAYYTY